MSEEKSPASMFRGVFSQFPATSTGTGDQGIPLTGPTTIGMWLAMFGAMMPTTRADKQVLGPVIFGVAVDVMHDFAGAQPTPDLLFCDKSVLVHQALSIGEVMAGASHRNVPVPAIEWQAERPSTRPGAEHTIEAGRFDVKGIATTRAY